MKIVIHPNTTRAELGAIVCEALADTLDDHPVLVGGAAASIYTKGRYRSNDLDIVTYRDRKKIAPLMHHLGFTLSGAHWSHPDTDLLIQFVAPPTMIGNKHVREPRRMRTREGRLPIISALDSACDRLAWYLNGDAQALDQCADIVIAQKLSLPRIRAWLRGEEWSKPKRDAALHALRQKIKHFQKHRRRR